MKTKNIGEKEMIEKKAQALVFERGQGTIEYLVILAIIVGIALVVVSVLSGFTNSSTGINQQQSNAYWQSQTVGFVSAVVDSNGDAIITVKSNSSEPITIEKFYFNDLEFDVQDTTLSAGEKTFYIEDMPPCNTPTCKYTPKIIYTRNSLSQTITGTTELIATQMNDVDESKMTFTNYNDRESGLIAAWHMNEGSGTVITDASGNGVNGTFGGGTSTPTWVNIQGSTYLSFDGNNDYVSLSNTRALDPQTGDWSWNGWLNFGGFTGTYRQIYSANASGGASGVGVGLRSGADSIRCEVNGSTGGRQYPYASTSSYLNE